MTRFAINYTNTIKNEQAVDVKTFLFEVVSAIENSPSHLIVNYIEDAEINRFWTKSDFFSFYSRLT